MRDEFYVLLPDGAIFGPEWAFADQVDPVNIGDAELCPACGRVVRHSAWLPPHRIKLSSAHPWKWGDLVWGAGLELLASDYFRRAYEAAGLRGIERFTPVEVVQAGNRKQNSLPPNLPRYYLLDITWNAANMDDAASGADRGGREKLCRYCRGANVPRRFDRLAIEPASWNGADIFVARGAPGSIIVSRRLTEIAERGQLKNVRFISANDFQYDEDVVPPFMGGMAP